MRVRHCSWSLFALALLINPSSKCTPLLELLAAAPENNRNDPKTDPKAGNAVEWEGWSFSWDVHPRAGVVVKDVHYRGLKVLKYAGLAEIFVPYNRGQPRPEDFGPGIAAQMQEIFPTKDCIPGSLSCKSFNKQGKEEGKRFVMMHEEATGLSYVGGRGRSYGKKLVLWNVYNLGGYHYINRWSFRDDGCLMPEIGMTGSLNHVGRGDSSPHGSVVGQSGKEEKVFAPSHVHNFYYCLDFDVDGPENNVVEEFNYQQDKPGSLSGTHSWTPIRTESARPGSAANFRSWRVVNHKSKNALGLSRSYEVIPSGNGIFRGGSAEAITQAELWVTQYHHNEYPVEKRPLRIALPGYLNDESVEGKDVVLWYVLHAHHLPRTEDWPAMPVEWVGFQLKPRDFLDSSPVQPK